MLREASEGRYERHRLRPLVGCSCPIDHRRMISIHPTLCLTTTIMRRPFHPYNGLTAQLHEAQYQPLLYHSLYHV